jgi:phage terminase Nu1 subunit (DNA packaging protein)
MISRAFIDTQTAPARVKRNGSKTNAPTLLSGGKLAAHFGVTRQHVDQLAQQHVIERFPSNLFDQDQARLAYLDHLRSQHRRSPRAEADGELARARAEWLRLRSAERMKELIPAEIYQQAIDELAGHTLTTMASIPARLYPYAQDLAERKRCEGVIRQVRQELAAKALRRVAALHDAIDKEAGEPPLSEEV